MKKNIGLFTAMAIVAVISGCIGGAIVQKDSLSTIRKIAVVSVVMPRIANTNKEANRATLQAVVDRAHGQAEVRLKSVRKWKVMNIDHYKNSSSAMSFTTVSDKEMEGLFPNVEERKGSKDIIVKEFSQWKKDFIGAKGLPIVPYTGLVSKNSQVPTLMTQHAAKLCSELKVDAVAFVHVLANVSHPRSGTFIVRNNRTDGTIRAAQTMVIVDKKGKILADMGWPKLDDKARSRDLLPLYIGKGQVAVKPENVSLGGPRTKILEAFSSLIDETSGDMIERLKKAAAQ